MVKTTIGCTILLNIGSRYFAARYDTNFLLYFYNIDYGTIYSIKKEARRGISNKLKIVPLYNTNIMP